jgi:hypothetical protein
MPIFEVNTTDMCPEGPSITADTYTPDAKVEQLKWLDIAMRAQGFCGQQELITLDEHISYAHDTISDEPDLARETLTDLLAHRFILRENFASKATYFTKDIPYDILSSVFRIVLDLVRAHAHMDLLAQPASLLRPSLDFAAVNKSWRRGVLSDAALWSFVPVHLGPVLQGDPYGLSQVKVYLDRIGDSIPVHLCVRGWTGDGEACTTALLRALPFLRGSAPEPNVKELTVIGTVDGNGTGTLKHLPTVFLPLVPALSGLSVLNTSSSIMHALSLPGFPQPTNLRMLNIDLRETDDWQDDWHFLALFKALGSSLRSFRLRTNGTPTSISSDRTPPAQIEIFVFLTELDICLDDIGGCLAGVLFGYHQFIGLQKLTLVTHGHWADIGFAWAQTGVVNYLKPRWLAIVAWAPQNTEPRDKTGFEWVISAIGDMDSIETLELRGVTGVNSHVQRFLGEIHVETPTNPSKTRFRNLKRLVLRDISFDATALAEFVENQKRGADSMDGYAHYIKVVFQGRCEGLRAVFEQQCPQGSAQQTPNTIANEIPVFEGGVNIPVKFLVGDEHGD